MDFHAFEKTRQMVKSPGQRVYFLTSARLKIFAL